MAGVPHSESRRLYSWWWDSHISPKNSKWLQDNLTDMDAKVKAMIKLIEEDADSFARRAEMYYKKRPELMKLVEEFYRAYRALAERYDHATGELRHAQRTLAAAFPDQVPFMSAEDSMTHLDAGKESRSFTGEFDGGIDKKGIEQLHEMLLGKLAEQKLSKGHSYDVDEKDESLNNENNELKAKVLSESERACRAECEVQNLKKSLEDLQIEKEYVLAQYQQSLDRLSCMEGELESAVKRSKCLTEQASRAEAEVFSLKEALSLLQADKDAGLAKQDEYLKMISDLKGMVSNAKEEAKGIEKTVVEVESEAQYLKKKISRLELEKETSLLQYSECLYKISALEKRISDAENEARLSREQALRAEIEVEKLKQALSEVKKEKEALCLLHEGCQYRITKLEYDLSSAQEDVKCLKSEVLKGTIKLKSAEEVCVRLEMSNRSLKQEADTLAKRIALKDQELSKKHEELEKLEICVQDEHLRYVQAEATLQTLQNIHTQSQEEQRALALELKNGLLMLEELDTCKKGLEEEMQQVKDENQSLNELNSSSGISIKNLEDEIFGLRKMKERLEEEFQTQLGRSNALQQEVFSLKDEIKELNSSYQELMKQVEFSGLSPESFGLSVKDLQNENSKLMLYKEENKVISEKIENMKELVDENSALRSSLSEVNSELEQSREKVKELKDYCQFHHGENSTLVLEKALLLSQLQIVTENLQKLMEKNNILENNLSGANVELGGLRVKSKSLEELCELLNNEKSNLVTERSNLVAQLQNVQQRLETLERKFTEFEEKYTGMERDKESTRSEVQELRASLSFEKQERETSMLSSETRLADLENRIERLQEDGKWRKREFLEEIDKAVGSQFETFFMKKLIEDMEERNYSLEVECEKHIEASKLAEKLISELESEILEQQVEEELLLVEIEKLRFGIHQVSKALEFGEGTEPEDKAEPEEIFVDDIIENIEDMKRSLLKFDDDRQLLLIENSVILTLVEKLNSKVQEMESEKNNLDHAYGKMKEELETEVTLLLEILEMRESEKSQLNDYIGRLEMEMSGVKSCNAELKQKLYKSENHRLRLSEDNENQKKETECLREVNGKLVSDLNASLVELEEHRIREDKLKDELEERENECELWEAEATRFYFDFQVSNIREVLFKSTVQELTEVCTSLEDKDGSKSLEIEKLKGKVSLMEGEIKGLKAQLLAYIPVISSLKENIASLEQNSLSLAKLIVAENQNPKAKVAPNSSHASCQELMGDQDSPIPNGISDLEELQTKIIAVEKVVVEDISRLVTRESSGIKVKQKPSFEDIQLVKSKSSSRRQREEWGLRNEILIKDDIKLTKSNDLKLIKTKPKNSELRKGVMMKDIPLDQISDRSLSGISKRGNTWSDDQLSELWQAAEDDRKLCRTLSRSKRLPYEPTVDYTEKDLCVDKSSSPTSENGVSPRGHKGKILQRLASDSQKLWSLQTTVKELKTKLDMNKKNKKAKGVDFDTVKEQLEEVEETVGQLVDLNDQLTVSVERSPTFSEGKGSSPEKEEILSARRKRVYEQARKGSEKIGRLQLEVQKIQFVLIKLDDEKKNKGKSRFSRTKSRTSIILRDFINNGRRSSAGRRKKGSFCGCFKPSPSTNGDSTSRMQLTLISGP